MGRGTTPGGLNALGSAMKGVGKFFGMDRLPSPAPRGFLGLQFDKDTTAKPKVVSVIADGRAAIAGIIPGDEIIDIDREKTENVAGVRRQLDLLPASAKISIAIIRDGVRIDKTVMLSQGF
jgi:C-terminal processing protease CtpA/Prc